MTTDRALDSYDVHNELSPILGEVEVLVQMADEIELGVSPAALRIGVLVSVIVEKVGDLRTSLDKMCGVKGSD